MLLTSDDMKHARNALFMVNPGKGMCQLARQLQYLLIK